LKISNLHTVKLLSACIEMLTTELKKSGASDVVVQGKLIINVSSNIGNQSAAAHRQSVQTNAAIHDRTPSVASHVSVASPTPTRNSMPIPSIPSVPSVPSLASSPSVNNGHVSAPANVASTPAATPVANGGRPLTAYEDQLGPLPAK
jgi:E3 ubiquitin-protein ligase NEDD4